MTTDRLNPEAVARIALDLKGLPAFEDKDLSELVDLACNLILFCSERALVAEQTYDARKFKELIDSSQVLPIAEAVKRVTGQSRLDRAKDEFQRFCKFLVEPNDLVNEAQRFSVSRELKRSQKGYRKGLCNWLAQIFPRWRQLEQSRLQSKRALKGPQKKVKKNT